MAKLTLDSAFGLSNCAADMMTSNLFRVSEKQVK